MAQVYSDFARVYDELMDNTPYEAWCENIVALVQQYGISVPIRDNDDHRKPSGKAFPGEKKEEAGLKEAALERMPSEEDVLAKALASERNLVLDLGCGTGTLTELL